MAEEVFGVRSGDSHAEVCVLRIPSWSEMAYKHNGLSPQLVCNLDEQRVNSAKGSFHEVTQFLFEKVQQSPTEMEMRLCPFPQNMMTSVWCPFQVDFRFGCPYIINLPCAA